MIKIISFDLQGTITNADYSDEFWLEILPQEYSKKYGVALKEAKNKLKEIFNKYGKYDYRYYSVKYWEKKLNFNFIDLMKTKKKKLVIEKELLSLAKKYPSILLTTTTFDFINLELENNKKIFKKIYSSLDTFNIAGKTKEVYELIAKDLGINTNEILHIGDSFEMDCVNAKEAGCKYYHLDKFGDINAVINDIIETFRRE